MSVAPRTDSFTVTPHVDAWAGGGRLEVGPGSVTVRIGPVTEKVTEKGYFVHTEPLVSIQVARLMPPWIGASLLLKGGGDELVVRMPRWEVRRLIEVLEMAGFGAEVSSGWLNSHRWH